MNLKGNFQENNINDCILLEGRCMLDRGMLNRKFNYNFDNP